MCDEHLVWECAGSVARCWLIYMVFPASDDVPAASCDTMVTVTNTDKQRSAASRVSLLSPSGFALGINLVLVLLKGNHKVTAPQVFYRDLKYTSLHKDRKS